MVSELFALTISVRQQFGNWIVHCRDFGNTRTARKPAEYYLLNMYGCILKKTYMTYRYARKVFFFY